MRQLIKKCILLVLMVMVTQSGLVSSQTSFAAATKKKSSLQKKKIKSSNSRAQTAPRVGEIVQAEESVTRSDEKEFKQALALAKQGRYQEASVILFQLSLSPKYASKRMQIRYLLGLMLYQMKMYQVSAFQFIGVIREGNNRFISQSLEKLSLAADQLGDDTLLNYAISRVKTDSFPAVHKDMLYYRIGEFQTRNSQNKGAIESFDQVPTNSPYNDKSMYMKGLALAQSGDAARSAEVFDQLYESKRGGPITDPIRVAALVGKARALYQKKDWDGAIEAYREVPKDTELWHDTIFESSWAMLRSGRFRTALSNFQSLHSPYYENTYIPESLLLRSIVYLYICKYDEMDKVLDLFNRLYRPLYKSVTDYLDKTKSPVQYFNDVVFALQEAEKESVTAAQKKSKVPYLMAQKASKEGDFQRSYQYIKKLIEERKIAKKMEQSWRNSGIGKYSMQTLDRRILKARAKAGRQIRAHMITVKTELIDLFEQEGFIRYEMINGRKELLKKRVAGKELPKEETDGDLARAYNIQNGYEYWPFRGEYWLDELGNYHYLGTQSCE